MTTTAPRNATPAPQKAFNSRAPNASRISGRPAPPHPLFAQRLQPLARVSLLLLAVAAATACHTAGPLPSFDLSQPGWEIRQGQAVWKPGSDPTEFAGELFFASHPGGQTFLQFAAGPFPLVTARTDGNRWQIDFIPENRSFSGTGTPPARLSWLHLSRVLEGNTPGAGWRSDGVAEKWRLQHRNSGETIEGFLQ